MGGICSMYGRYNTGCSLQFDQSGDLTLEGRVIKCCPFCNVLVRKLIDRKEKERHAFHIVQGNL